MGGEEGAPVVLDEGRLVPLGLGPEEGLLVPLPRLRRAAPLVDRGDMTELEVAIQEILQDKIAIDYEASGLEKPEII